MVNGLYSVMFGTPGGDVGGGIVVFNDGKAQGGDLTYFYQGSLHVDPAGLAQGEVHVRRYQEAGESVFGNLPEFQLTLRGQAHGANFTLVGQISGQPRHTITVQCNQLAI